LVSSIKISIEEAREKSAEVGDDDPLPEIDTSLLSSDQIVQYVRATGMISPFEVRQEDSDSRLKNASYEGRVGNFFYYFNENGKIIKKGICSSGLIVPHNSIIFVETDLQFRFPTYIAMRFNLSIRHVHRGLLLGTGPLVDPGFRGILCIPLHNLTNKPYKIRKDDGLIWIELTKIAKSCHGYGRPALHDMQKTGGDKDPGYWSAKDYLLRASDVDRAGSKEDSELSQIPIQSSIPHIIQEARDATAFATEKAKEALQKSKEAKEAADSAKLADKVALVSVLLGIGTFVTIMFMVYQKYSDETERNYQIIEKMHVEIQSLKQTVEKFQLWNERVDVKNTPKNGESQNKESE